MIDFNKFTTKFKIGKVLCVVDNFNNYYLAHELLVVTNNGICSVRNFPPFRLLFNATPFEEIEQIGGEFVKVKKGGMWNIINTITEKYITKQWFESIENFNRVTNIGNPQVACFAVYLAKVKRGNRYNFLNSSGYLISRKWFDYLGDYRYFSSWAVARRDGKYNYLNCLGGTKFNKWCDYCQDFSEEGYGLVHNEGKSFIVDSYSDKKHTLAELRKTWKDCVLDEMMGFK